MLRRLWRLASRCQRGQVIVVAVGVMALGLAAIMISVDVGWWLRDKRDAQNDADAIALAAVQEIGDPSRRDQAVAAGLDWANFNGVDTSEVVAPACTDGVLRSNFCFIDRNSDGTDDKVRVKVSRPSNSFIAEALGVGSPTLSPPAAAATVYVKGACLMPWGIVGEDDDPHSDPDDPGDPFGLDPDALYLFQNTGDFAGGGTSPGNYGALNMYGNGATTYRETIEGKCEPTGKDVCTTDPMVFVDETLVDCQTKPGDMGNNTDTALDLRFQGSPSPGACDAATYDEALDRVDPGSSTYCPERLVPVVIIDAFPPSGAGDIDVYGIANFYLAGWTNKKKNGCFMFPDGSERCGYVWGYLITSAPASTAKVVFTKDFVPFAPTGIALVE